MLCVAAEFTYRTIVRGAGRTGTGSGWPDEWLRSRARVDVEYPRSIAETFVLWWACVPVGGWEDIYKGHLLP